MIFILGLGYSATVFARRMRAAGWQVGGTVRTAERAALLRSEGIEASSFDASGDDSGVLAAPLQAAEALLISIPPSPMGDPLPDRLAKIMAGATKLRWIGYLSTVGVYGDHGGAWIDETTPATPASPRSRARLEAEAQWRALGELAGKPVIVFRLPGIYGPARNALVALRKGTARRIVKPGQMFNRVHVDDIATGLSLSLAKDSAEAVYNLTDDEPSPPQDVIAYAAELLGVEAPPEIAFAEADLSPMAASFYAESKRVRNLAIKRALGFAPAFPSYREGLQALLRQGEGAS
ncbi:Nucleoside-diphosphate-sugar epimerase [Rhizobiales bacterium GAS191]|nr:Nucleoside-diphosphate-sugar epimerase [Rhizobiales bacterium GAS113]SED89187.1 Nucleoside-diphosphate-sugar epimerase [Rhizobiales bacterium GAS191]SEE57076.1 Nucleoside-diphosphate-sugar epimerase [Rhizobiales bacterium GAS188]